MARPRQINEVLFSVNVLHLVALFFPYLVYASGLKVVFCRDIASIACGACASHTRAILLVDRGLALSFSHGSVGGSPFRFKNGVMSGASKGLASIPFFVSL